MIERDFFQRKLAFGAASLHKALETAGFMMAQWIRDFSLILSLDS